MWEAIKEVLTSSNSLQILIFVTLLILLGVLLIRGNYLRIRTQHLKIGTDETERAILRQQIEYSNQYITGLYGLIKSKYPKFDTIKTKYILEVVYDEVVNWISFNHISKSEIYIMVKQEKIRGLIFEMDVTEGIKSNEFKELMNAWTKEIINRLVDIREYNSK
jgi:hypothetical protein